MILPPTPFLSLLAKIPGADLRPEQFSEDSAKRLRREQICGTIEQMRIMLACNTFFAPALSFQVWNCGVNGLVIAWTAGILCFSWWLFFAWRKAYETKGHAADMRRFVLETIVNSGFWALGMALFFPIVEGDQKAIVTTIMAGSLALGTVGFSRAPSAAFAYLSVQTISNSLVALLTAISRNSTTDYMVSFLSLAAGISLLNAVIERGKSSITAFKNHEELSEKTDVVDLLLKDYEEQTTEWLWQTDAQGNITRCPSPVLELLGADIRIGSAGALVDLITANTCETSIDDVHRLQSAFQSHQDFHDIEFAILDPRTGQTRWILMKGRPQYSSGKFKGFRGLFADATVSIEAERKVNYMANYDSLTGLLNRNSLKKHLSELVPGLNYAAAFLIDLDGFKQINDSYGHHIGDCLLKDAALRLQDCLHPNWVAARLGGDEFLVLMISPTPLDRAAISTQAKEIVRRLSQPYQAENFNMQVSTSVGVACFPNDTESGTDLLALADLALYHAKHNGRNRYDFFEPSLQDELTERIAITERLRIAVRNGDIKPHYQTQHALGDGSILGLECLARWTDSELGPVGPNVFIPIAEQTGLIEELGEQILFKACQHAAEWERQLGAQTPIVSVNISPVQFARIDVTTLVIDILKKTGLSPNRLEIEITEGVLISNKDKVAETLRELSEFGVSIALDDFGTGYSSLSYLKDLPLDRLKIDRSFVTALEENNINPIVKTIIQLGHSLGLSVIAEGIEDQTQARMLDQMGCDDGQGYLFSVPVPFEKANEAVMSSQHPRAITG